MVVHDVNTVVRIYTELANQVLNPPTFIPGDPTTSDHWAACYSNVLRLRPRLVCTICRTILLDPHSPVSCDHHFCHTCIITHLSQYGKCPVCHLSALPKDLCVSDRLSAVVHLYREMCKLLAKCGGMPAEESDEWKNKADIEEDKIWETIRERARSRGFPCDGPIGLVHAIGLTLPISACDDRKCEEEASLSDNDRKRSRPMIKLVCHPNGTQRGEEGGGGGGEEGNRPKRMRLDSKSEDDNKNDDDNDDNDALFDEKYHDEIIKTSLLDLFEAGFISEGQLVNRRHKTAVISSEGLIEANGKRFDSPTKWVEFSSKRVRGVRTAEYSWTKTMVEGVPMAKFRRDYFKAGYASRKEERRREVKTRNEPVKDHETTGILTPTKGNKNTHAAPSTTPKTPKEPGKTPKISKSNSHLPRQTADRARPQALSSRRVVGEKMTLNEGEIVLSPGWVLIPPALPQVTPTSTKGELLVTVGLGKGETVQARVAEAGQIKVGSRVLALWSDGVFYPGTAMKATSPTPPPYPILFSLYLYGLVRKSTGRVEVAYDGGDVQSVLEKNVKLVLDSNVLGPMKRLRRQQSEHTDNAVKATSAEPIAVAAPTLDTSSQSAFSQPNEPAMSLGNSNQSNHSSNSGSVVTTDIAVSTYSISSKSSRDYSQLQEQSEPRKRSKNQVEFDPNKPDREENKEGRNDHVARRKREEGIALPIGGNEKIGKETMCPPNCTSPKRTMSRSSGSTAVVPPTRRSTRLSRADHVSQEGKPSLLDPPGSALGGMSGSDALVSSHISTKKTKEIAAESPKTIEVSNKSPRTSQPSTSRQLLSSQSNTAKDLTGPDKLPSEGGLTVSGKVTLEPRRNTQSVSALRTGKYVPKNPKIKLTLNDTAKLTSEPRHSTETNQRPHPLGLPAHIKPITETKPITGLLSLQKGSMDNDSKPTVMSRPIPQFPKHGNVIGARTNGTMLTLKLRPSSPHVPIGSSVDAREREAGASVSKNSIRSPPGRAGGGLTTSSISAPLMRNAKQPTMRPPGPSFSPMGSATSLPLPKSRPLTNSKGPSKFTDKPLSSTNSEPTNQRLVRSGGAVSSRMIGQNIGGQPMGRLIQSASTIAANKARIQSNGGKWRVIAFSSLKPIERSARFQAVNELGGEVITAAGWVDSTTHLVTGTCENVDLAIAEKRTMKYLLAIMAGIWVVSLQWIDDSIKAGRWLDEAKYEIAGDQLALGAPAKARLARCHGSPELFSGLAVYFHGKFSTAAKPSMRDLEKIVTLGGAETISNYEEYMRRWKEMHTKNSSQGGGIEELNGRVNEARLLAICEQEIPPTKAKLAAAGYRMAYVVRTPDIIGGWA
eukprot:Ihof_evm1s173 gene=Ihof_evmTU1s173